MGRQIEGPVRISQRREEMRQHANALELLYLQHNLPDDLRTLERPILRIAGGHFNARNMRELQDRLNEAGARDFSGRVLEESGRLDRSTMLALFSYFQQWPAPLVPLLRAAVYPRISEGAGNHDEIWSRVFASAGCRDVRVLHTFLYAAGYRDFRNREIAPDPDLRTLFALQSFLSGLDGDAVADLIRRAGLRSAPSRTELPRILFPVQPAEAAEWHRGSYGTRSWRSGAIHRAIDIFAPLGTAVLAPLSGEVVHIGHEEVTRSAGGNVIIIRSDEGLFFLFSHLHRIDVTLGQRVERGAQIAIVGATGGTPGHPVRDPHLHFEVFREEERRGRRAVRKVHYNPADLFE